MVKEELIREEISHMKNLSFIEFVAVLFTGVAGLASATQAYVSWETRGEVSRAIVFAQRIDACSKVMAAIDPFLSKAKQEGRDLVASGQTDGRYSLPNYYYRLPSGNAAFNAKHGPRVDKWRVAVSAFRIVAPDGAKEQIEYFDRIITKEISEGKFMKQADLITWLETLETNSKGLAEGCRGLV